MAAFLARQMVGNQLSAVKDKKTDTLSAEDKAKLEEEERERLAAIQEAKQARIEKHRKMEAEREKMRQAVRDKYGIKKKDANGVEVTVEPKPSRYSRCSIPDTRQYKSDKSSASSKVLSAWSLIHGGDR
ncbi:putative complexin-1 [Fragariocoptes setiger]|uniref:Complexin-1 n=1 Tax=Fragariocoptes setiger TaxID=1670756 RepID=A0ABQ7SCM2_9ACAR|nr:putative complexin-1 [Fragariocoptes setiger]